MGTGFWGHRFRQGCPRSGPHHSREEAVVARRAYTRMPTLEIRITFEPSRVGPACVVQAYEQVVPLGRRTTAAGSDRRPVDDTPETPCVGRRQVS